jgi:hypothetical protein
MASLSRLRAVSESSLPRKRLTISTGLFRQGNSRLILTFFKQLGNSLIERLEVIILRQ